MFKGIIKAWAIIFTVWLLSISVFVKYGLTDDKPLWKGILTVNSKLSVKKAKYYETIIIGASYITDIDPYLIASVIAAESSFSESAKGSAGELGLMQLRPQFHGNTRMYTGEQINIYYHMPFYNIMLGAKYLRLIRDKYCNKYHDFRYVEYFNRGINSHPKMFRYYERVMKFYRLLRGNSGRKVNKGGPRRNTECREAFIPRNAYLRDTRAESSIKDNAKRVSLVR